MEEKFKTLTKEDKIYNLNLTLKQIDLKIGRLESQKQQVSEKIQKLQLS